MDFLQAVFLVHNHSLAGLVTPSQQTIMQASCLAHRLLGLVQLLLQAACLVLQRLPHQQQLAGSLLPRQLASLVHNHSLAGLAKPPQQAIMQVTSLLPHPQQEAFLRPHKGEAAFLVPRRQAAFLMHNHNAACSELQP